MSVKNVIDLNAVRNARSEPASEFVHQDDYGRKMYVFLIDYEMDGKTFGSQIWAYDDADAEQRLAAIRSSAVIAGKLYEQIPA
jgi:hypothetical protein